MPFSGWLLSEMRSGFDRETESDVAGGPEGLARRKKKGTISENYTLEEPKAITFAQTKLFPTKEKGDPDAKTVPPHQRTRMATTGRIAAEGHLVHSIEDADPYSPPSENQPRNSPTQDLYHLYLCES